jgi:hypothetical protein
MMLVDVPDVAPLNMKMKITMPGAGQDKVFACVVVIHKNVLG